MSESHAPEHPAVSTATTGRVRTWLLAAAVLASVGLAIQRGEGEDQVAPEAPPALPVGTPRRDTITVEQAFAAEIVAVRRAELRARVGGLLEAPEVDEGARVAEGAPLFRLNPRALEQEVAAARALVRQAEADLAAATLERDNSRALVERDVVSAADLALDQAKVDALQATVAERQASARLAEVQRDHATVRAPFAGVVNRIPLKAGSLVEPGDLLTTITDASEVFAYFHLAEREALAWLGDPARAPELRLQLADGSFLPDAGVLDAVEAEVDENGTLAMRARFANREGRLRHGSTATVVVRERLDRVVLVPQRSTFDVQGNYYVYVVDEAGVAHARRVVPGGRHGEDFVVQDGLTDGDRLVLEGVQRVRDGDRVVVASDRDGAAWGE